MSGGGNNPYGYDGYGYDMTPLNPFSALRNVMLNTLTSRIPQKTPTPTTPVQNTPYVPQYQPLPQQQQYAPQQPYTSSPAYNQGIASVVDIYNAAANQALNNPGITALPTQQKQSSE